MILLSELLFNSFTKIEIYEMCTYQYVKVHLGNMTVLCSHTFAGSNPFQTGKLVMLKFIIKII